MNDRLEPRDRQLARRGEQTIARRSSTLVARGLMDVERAAQNPETVALIAPGDIFAAVDMGDIEAVRKIVRSSPHTVNLRATTGAVGCTPLYWAAAGGHADIANLLIAAGADVHAGDGRPLCAAASRGSIEILRALIAAGANVNQVRNLNRTPLHDAATKEMVNALIDAGAGVEARDEDDLTALMTHCCPTDGPDGPNADSWVWPRSDLIAALLARGADPNARDKCGATALHWIIRHARWFPSFTASLEIATFLLRAGVDPTTAMISNVYGPLTCVGSPGDTALHEAVLGTRPDLAARLLEWDADPDAKDAAGRTPLHYAVWGAIYEELHDSEPIVRAACIETVEVLLAAGADPFIESNDGTTPYYLATSRGTTRIAALVESFIR
ncbi:MAG: ankyrin repeat domain-containing protein [Planctomycetales bacterium]